MVAHQPRDTFNGVHKYRLFYLVRGQKPCFAMGYKLADWKEDRQVVIYYLTR